MEDRRWIKIIEYGTDLYTHESAEQSSNVVPHWGEYWNVLFFFEPTLGPDGLEELTVIHPKEEQAWLNVIILGEWLENNSPVYTQYGEKIYKCVVKGVDGFYAVTNACRRMTPYHMQKYGLVDGWSSNTYE